MNTGIHKEDVENKNRKMGNYIHNRGIRHSKFFM